MPHDCANQELKVGDEVMILAKVTAISSTEDYCNCELETVYGRRPDGQKERICAINTAVVARCPDKGASIYIGGVAIEGED